jgi:xylulokinase
MPVLFDDNAVAARLPNGAAQGCGLADAWAEAMVAGADEPGDALIICGTTLIVWPVVAEPAVVDGLWTIPHPHSGNTILGGASNAGGMFINWARRALAGATPRLDPSGVPLWVPYVRGERSPIHDSSLRASLHDLDVSMDASALMRSAYEASAFVARRLLEAAGSTTTRIVASGGGTHDEQWMQSLADCTGLAVETVAVAEGAALGAAWRARVVAGLDTDAEVGRWVRRGHRYDPDPRWQPLCEERYQRWSELAAV